MILDSRMLPIPNAGRKILDEWVQKLKKGRDEFRKTVDESCEKNEEALQWKEPMMGSESRRREARSAG